MRIKTLFMTLVLFVVMVIPQTVMATDKNALTETPRYLQTENFGYYACYTNILYQYINDNWKLVLDLGTGTTAHNRNTGQTISDWRSFYITDLTSGKSNPLNQYENILISGLVMIPDPNNNTRGRLADVFIMYYPYTGETKTLNINLRYPMEISKEQHNMTKPFEYLEQDVLFPRGIIPSHNSTDVFVLSGAADLNVFESKNKEMLENVGYGGDFFEIVRLTMAHSTAYTTYAYSEFFGSLEVFGKHNPRFQISELEGLNHTIDRRLIVFRTDDARAFTIASVGTDNSDFCTALAINIFTKPEDEYYWIDRNKFLELAGMSGKPAGMFGINWTEKDMDSYIDK